MRFQEERGYAVSGTPTRLLGTRHLSQTLLSERDFKCKCAHAVSGTPTRLLGTRHLSQTLLSERDFTEV